MESRCDIEIVRFRVRELWGAITRGNFDVTSRFHLSTNRPRQLSTTLGNSVVAARQTTHILGKKYNVRGKCSNPMQDLDVG
jgi:hypothetical protein